MDIGMLWYQSDKNMTLEQKVKQAVDYYQNKYGVRPTQCYVHPAMLEGASATTLAGVRLKPNRTVIKNHFWLGTGEK